MEFSYDRNCIFSPANGQQYQLESQPDSSSHLVVNLVSAAGQVKESDQVFQFFLQPTPLRPTPPPPQADRLELWFENWSDYQSYPDMTKLPAIKERAASAHAQDKSFYLYFGHVMAENAPEFQDYKNDLIRPPDSDNGSYFRMYDPGKGIPCRAICFRGASGDLLLEKIRQIADASGLDGVYLDGPSVPFPCENWSHGCSDSAPASWDDNYREGRILGQRVFLKRLRGIFDERGKDYPLWVHTGGAFQLSCLGLCDFFYDGEHLSRYRYGYLLEPYKFIMGYTGTPFGFRGFFLSGLYVTSTLTLKQAMPWTLAHGAESSQGTHPLQSTVFDLYKRDKNTQFHGYWQAQPHISYAKNNLLVSYYLAGEEAFLVVSNVTYHGTQSTEIALDGLFPGQSLAIDSINSTEALARNGNTLRVTVPEAQMRLYHIAPADVDKSRFKLPNPTREQVAVAAAKPLATVTEFQPEAWTIANQSDRQVKLPANSSFPVVLVSEKDQEPATIQLNQRLPDDFKLCLRFAHNDNLRIQVDDVKIRYDVDDGWIFGWLIEGIDEFDQGDYSQVTLIPQGRNYTRPDQEIEVTLLMRDGRLAMLYDGCQILTDGLPAKAYGSHSLRISSWGGDWVAFDVELLTPEVSDSDIPQRIHPVR